MLNFHPFLSEITRGGGEVFTLCVLSMYMKKPMLNRVNTQPVIDWVSYKKVYIDRHKHKHAKTMRHINT